MPAVPAVPAVAAVPALAALAARWARLWQLVLQGQPSSLHGQAPPRRQQANTGEKGQKIFSPPPPRFFVLRGTMAKLKKRVPPLLVPKVCRREVHFQKKFPGGLKYKTGRPAPSKISEQCYCFGHRSNARSTYRAKPLQIATIPSGASAVGMHQAATRTAAHIAQV